MQNKKSIMDVFIDTKKPITEIYSKELVVSHENERLRDVLSLMLTKKFRKIPIVDKSGHLRGIVTSIDILDLFGGGEKYSIFKKKKENMDIRVEKFMTRHVRTINFKTSIKKSMEVFKKEGFGLCPVVNSKKILGVVSEQDFIKQVNKPIGIKVYEAMVEKPIFAKKGYSVYDTAKMMCRGGYRRLPIVEDNILLGIVTPTDILLYLHKNGIEDKLVSDRTRIGRVMNKEPVTIRDDTDLFSAINVMRRKRAGGLPVVEDDELVGIITERDILDVLL
ncbi:MAG: CBS domain-containing protein [Candidatus Aenigmarchaeota archaeon]